MLFSSQAAVQTTGRQYIPREPGWWTGEVKHGEINFLFACEYDYLLSRMFVWYRFLCVVLMEEKMFDSFQSSPEKLDRIGEYLYQKATKDINRRRYKWVMHLYSIVNFTVTFYVHFHL